VIDHAKKVVNGVNDQRRRAVLWGRGKKKHYLLDGASRLRGEGKRKEDSKVPKRLK